jgi:light-regulated signal transduction histidine kinase (bacteriophytochrome)
MENLLQDLLDYTTVTKSMEGPPASVDPSIVLAEVLENLKTLIEQEGAVVTSNSLPTVAMHEGRLAPILFT